MYGERDGSDEVETASDEDDDRDSTDDSECDGWTTEAKETEKDGSIAGDRDKEENTPEEGLSKMHK
jgi:hypothetical protein